MLYQFAYISDSHHLGNWTTIVDCVDEVQANNVAHELLAIKYNRVIGFYTVTESDGVTAKTGTKRMGVLKIKPHAPQYQTAHDIHLEWIDALRN